jgi:syntaxin 1B/2/3
MNDRLKEIQTGSSGAAAPEDVELGIVKNAENGEPQGEDFMNDFFKEVGAIKTSMSAIRRNIKSIEEKYVQALNSISVDQSGKGGNELNSLMESTSAIVAEVRAKLENMKKSNTAFAALKGVSPTEVRIRTNMHGTLTQKFLELVQEYQEVQTNYKNKYKEKVERQYKIAKPDATPEEIEDAMTSGDSSKIFANQILDTHLHAQAKSALAYIEARHKDILRLEASIAELHQLFVDMAVLVESQGEMLNQIEYNVNQSVAYTAQGVQELRSAVKHQKRGRKKMYILIVILLIIIVVVLAPVLSTSLNSDTDA